MAFEVRATHNSVVVINFRTMIVRKKWINDSMAESEKENLRILCPMLPKHPRIVPIFKEFPDGYTMPYMGRSMNELIKTGWPCVHPITNLPVPLGTQCGIMREMLQTLQALHNSGIVHMDIKPGNVLMYDTKTPHLCDFGLSRFTGMQCNGSGTRGFLPHDGFKGGVVWPGIDVYCAGATFACMLAGFPEENVDDAITTLNSFSALSQGGTGALITVVDIVRKMLMPCVCCRITIEDAVKSLTAVIESLRLM